MLLSIVTVCLNAEQLIGRTIDSVLRQDMDDYEYLIVDGASADRTLAIAESYRPAFDEKGIRYTIVSERDSGIYNAMNKGARLASGEWICYMNAGDAFFRSLDAQQIPPGPDGWAVRCGLRWDGIPARRVDAPPDALSAGGT